MRLVPANTGLVGSLSTGEVDCFERGCPRLGALRQAERSHKTRIGSQFVTRGCAAASLLVYNFYICKEYT